MSSVIGHIDKVNPTIAVLYMRVSTDEQRRKGNLRGRAACLRADVTEIGIRIAGEHASVECGKIVRAVRRPSLAKAVQVAKALQASHPNEVVAVVTDCRNRFARGRGYNGTAVSDELTERQHKQLARLANGVPLATLLDPEVSFDTVRRYETMIRKRCGGRVGRPSKSDHRPASHRFTSEEREGLIARAHTLRRRLRSKREIARRLGVSESLVRRWLKTG